MIVIKILLFIIILVILVSLIIECVDLEIKIKDQDDRILQLEKRIEEYKKEDFKNFDRVNFLAIEVDAIIKRIEKLERKKKSDKE